MHFYNILLLLLGIGAATAQSLSTNPDLLLSRGREAFAAAQTEKDSVDKAIQHFKQLAKNSAANQPVADVYIGALYALKGKYAFLPPIKLEWVNRGMDMMDAAVAAAPTNPEVLLVRGNTYFNLPGLFGKKRQAIADMNAIFALWPEHPMPDSLLRTFIGTIEAQTDMTLSEENKHKLQQMKKS